ncbi:MAG: hypothetical protein K2W96_18520 [Gemmataceae bacterium]|nr:hypothetical protein [Gemmataceae bacterium]
MGICTHCGKHARTTRDHAVASCLRVGEPRERGILVPSCASCNNRSEEGLLKSFMSLFDERLASGRLGRELLHPKGRGDLRSFLRTFAPSPWKSYPDERVTRLFKKMLQGLRRHLVGDAWAFVPADAMRVFGLSREGRSWKARLWPLKAGGPNRGVVVPEGWPDESRLSNGYGGFRFGDLGDGVLGLRYGRTFVGNELFLAAWFGGGDAALSGAGDDPASSPG